MALKQIPVPNTIIHNAPPPLVEVQGTHREMGCQIGEARREQVQHSIENAHLLIEQSYSTLELTWGGAIIQSKKYLPFAEERYPQYVDEMRGVAEGANVSFEDVMALNAMEAVTMDALHLTRCTSLAVNEECTADGHVLAAHNEDWVPEDENDVYVILAKPQDDPPFLAMTYGGPPAKRWIQRLWHCPADRLCLSQRLTHRHPAPGSFARGTGFPPPFGRDRPHADLSPCRRIQPFDCA